MNPIPNVSDLERAHGVTWGQLAGLEPQLAELLWQARTAGASCQGPEDVHRVFAPFRDALAELVGLRGKHRNCPILGSVGAYEVAYWRLHEAVTGPVPQPAAATMAARVEGRSSIHHEREQIVDRKPQTVAGSFLAAVGNTRSRDTRPLVSPT